MTMPEFEPLIYMQEEWLEYKVVRWGDPAGFPVFTEDQLKQAYEAGRASMMAEFEQVGTVDVWKPLDGVS